LTGQEDKVKATIDSKIQEGALKDKVFQVLIPTEQVSEVKDGKKKISLRKFFPGYVLVEMDINDDIWYVIRNIPGVTGFIGSKSKPPPFNGKRSKPYNKADRREKEKPTPKVVFEKGDNIKIIEGPFINFNAQWKRLTRIRARSRSWSPYSAGLRQLSWNIGRQNGYKRIALKG